MTPQKPAQRAYEQCSVTGQRWLDETYPAIAARSQAEGAEIHWGDEVGVRSDAREGRSYAPRGATPGAPIPARRVRVPMISTVTNAGQLRFMLFKEPMHATLLIRFFKRLIASSDRKVFVILDNLPVHRSHVVRDWVHEHADAIALFYLPSYSPQLNPDEYLNNDLKARVHRHPPARSARVHVSLRKIDRTPRNASSKTVWRRRWVDVKARDAISARRTGNLKPD